MLCAAGAAGATEFDMGNPDMSLRWDNTVRYNIAVRVEGKDPKIANAPNTDESDNKFGRGHVVNNRVDLFSELDWVYKKQMGARLERAGWYDAAYDDHHVPTAPQFANSSYDNNTYSSFTKRFYNGPSAEFLDAFVFGNWDFGGSTLRLKAGKHSIFWGDVVFNATTAWPIRRCPAIRASRLSSPGVEAKETVLPLNQLSAQLQIADNLAVAASTSSTGSPIACPKAAPTTARPTSCSTGRTASS